MCEICNTIGMVYSILYCKCGTAPVQHEVSVLRGYWVFDVELQCSLSSLLRNIRRTVEVWLDEYKPLYYEKVKHALDIDYGE